MRMAPYLTRATQNAKTQQRDASKSKGKYFFYLKFCSEPKYQSSVNIETVLTQKGFLSERLMHSFEGYASAHKRVSQQREIHTFQAPTMWLKHRRVRASKKGPV